mmetsp:Transcript_1347/g.4560  ORF Transcript_1347/g.4560 Transcript_1347/m.4560 type:complete len:322 (-) Transcript_1347:917-1882(-)
MSTSSSPRSVSSFTEARATSSLSCSTSCTFLASSDTDSCGGCSWYRAPARRLSMAHGGLSPSPCATPPNMASTRAATDLRSASSSTLVTCSTEDASRRSHARAFAAATCTGPSGGSGASAAAAMCSATPPLGRDSSTAVGSTVRGSRTRACSTRSTRSTERAVRPASGEAILAHALTSSRSMSTVRHENTASGCRVVLLTGSVETLNPRSRCARLGSASSTLSSMILTTNVTRSAASAAASPAPSSAADSAQSSAAATPSRTARWHPVSTSSGTRRSVCLERPWSSLTAVICTSGLKGYPAYSSSVPARSRLRSRMADRGW